MLKYEFIPVRDQQKKEKKDVKVFKYINVKMLFAN